LPVMKRLLENVNMMAKAFGGDDPQGLSERARELAGTYDGQGSGAYNLGLALRNVADAFGNVFATINGEGPKSTSTLQNFADAVNTVANGINALADAYGKLDKFVNSTGYQRALDIVFGPKEPLIYKPKGKAAGGSVMGGEAYRVGEFGPEMFVPSGSGSIRPAGGGGGNTVININGVIDAESARRSIEKLLQNSARRTGPINLIGATL